LFNDRLRMALSNVRRSGKRMGLFFIDLDRFKQINDSLGHDVGDELLISVAQRIKSVIREVDTVARLGGDEFSVILPNLKDRQDAALVASKILEVCQPAIHVGSHHLLSSPSIGIALFPENGDDESSLLRRADLAMYRAKAEGGNTYRFFEQGDEGDADSLTLETAFRAALKRDELYLVYQPQMAADCSEIVGVEALMRWRHPEFGEVSPNVFIPIAEWTGAITEIGHWVIRTACRQMSEWRDAGIPIRRVAVNISPRQLRAQNFPKMVIDELLASGLPGSALELEITESELMLYPEITLNKLAELRSYGISIAVDDFGTGYSNLARLRALPIDRIKVDRSFVLDIEADANAKAISSCIVTLAKAMNLEVVAEGVETHGQLKQLLHQGCDLIQGYLFGRPMTPEVLNTWFHEDGAETQR
jgi:diguanylate cyclase (GGDEF)-like protein